MNSHGTMSRRHAMIAITCCVGGGTLFVSDMGRSQVTVGGRRELAALDVSNVQVAFLREGARTGRFVWRAGDLRDRVGRDPLQGIYVAGADATGEAGAWAREYEVLRPEMFGAVGIGDDTEALQAFADQLGTGVVGEVSLRHTVSRELRIGDRTGFTLRGSGTIAASNGVPSSYGYALLRIGRCRDFRLEGLRFDGNRAGRMPRELPAHNIIFDSCSNFVCEGVRSDNAVVDGFILLSETPADPDTHCSNFRLIDCHADNCHRQGCSVIHGHDGAIVGGSFTRTNGAEPSAGIDLESDRGAPIHSIRGISIENVLLEGNQGYGLMISPTSQPRDIKVTGCRFVSNATGAISWGAMTGSMDRLSIDGFTERAVRGAIDIPAGAGCVDVRIIRPEFRNITASSASRPLVYVHSESGGHVWITGLNVDSCAAVAAFWADNCKLLDSHIVSDCASFHGAILVYGDNCEASRNRIDRFYGAVIFVEGRNFRAEENVLTEPRFNDERGCLRVFGRDAILARNFMRGRGVGYGIVARAPRSMEANRIEGFSNAYEIVPA